MLNANLKQSANVANINLRANILRERLVLFMWQPKAGLGTIQYIEIQCIHKLMLCKTKATKLKHKSKPNIN